MSQHDPLSTRRAQLSPTKQALLAQLRRGKLQGTQETTGIEKRRTYSPALLSFGQQRLLFFEQLHPGMPFYTITDAIRLSGSLQKASLDQALWMLKERHEILRTTYALVDDELMQIIAALPAQADCIIPVIDLTALSAEEQDRSVVELARQEMQHTFDVAHDSLIRFTLLRLQETKHVLLLSIHHSIFDGWSAPILYQELTAFYNALVRGDRLELPALPIQYADFAVWQRQRLQGAFLQEQLVYWVQQLAGVPPRLQFPASRSRTEQATFQSKCQKILLPRQLVDDCQRLSSAEGATLFMLLLSALGVVLALYAEQDDFVVGTPIANRPWAELTSLIGFFINTLVMRITLSGVADFRGLLAQVRQTALGAYAHQELPFEKLIEALRPERTASLNPLLQVLFVLQNGTLPQLDFAGLQANSQDYEGKLARFDLTLELIENEQGLLATMDYNTDVLDDAIISRMLTCFTTVLSTVAAQPEIPLARLKELLRAQDRQAQSLKEGKLKQERIASLQQARRKVVRNEQESER